MKQQRQVNRNPVRFVKRGWHFLLATLACLCTLVSAPVIVFAQTAQVDALFAGWNKPDSPGCAVGVIQNGKLVFQRGYGMATLEHNVPLAADTVFYIASTSKQFTAMSVALLVTQGRLALTDDIHKYVPELPRWNHPVTVGHLVYHTSGIPDFFALTPLSGRRLEDTATDEDILALLARQKTLNFQPGEQFQYSNSGYFLLGVIVSRVTGKSLRAFAEEALFAPLGMRNTHFHDDRTMIVPKRATGYVPSAGGFSIFATLFDRVGDGGVMTTIEDLVKWDQNFYDAKVGGKAMIDLALTPGTLNNGSKLDYAFGLFVREYRGLLQVSHGGIYNGFRADLIRFPAQKFSVACLCNLYSIDVSKLAQRVADLYLAGQYTKPEPVETLLPAITLTTEQLQQRVGTYFAPDSGTVINLRLAEGKIVAAIPGGGILNQQLIPIRANQFKATNSLRSNFEFAEGTTPSALRVQLLPGIGQPTFSFVPAEAVSPDEKQLMEYAGRYYSAALDATYEVTVKEGSVVLQYRNTAPKKLLPTVRDSFSVGGFNYVFTRDAQQKLNGFYLSDVIGRIRKIPFIRQ
ncbi:MAG TPA: serine hydrolase domain-containing protein [Blastocatellia bacterium]|nr:serine hydrolase domain-containing protein [Blastocatellia bacterium]HMX25093.1 serine hydrolase domain-containing protein [Blastocatellia bacterium]HMZ17805.1 serine hydrolase domain-containing protein [Blastocatellia bacterium]HNG30736.1 serine hydrolase domain-containing protein [Blastocatellia bacterium]